MKLSDLFLNRWLCRKNSQSMETQGAGFESLDSSGTEPTPIPSGGAAQDINTGNVQIDGNQLEPGTFPTTVLDVSNWGWGQTCAFSSTDADTVSWGSGTFTSASGDTYSISAGDTGNMSAKTYIYLSLLDSETEYQTSTTSSDSVGVGKVLIAVAENGASSATYNLQEANQIVGDNILANTIDASKINVGQLSAISADIGTITAGSIDASSVTISNLTVGGNVNIGTAFASASAGDLATRDDVGTGQIDTTVISGGKIVTGLLTASNIQTGTLNASLATITNIDADNITTGTLTGRTVQTSSSGARVELDGSNNRLSVYDSSGIERTRLASENLYFYDSSGNERGQMFVSTVSLGGTSFETINLTSTGSNANVLIYGHNTLQLQTGDNIILEGSNGNIMLLGDGVGGGYYYFDTNTFRPIKTSTDLGSSTSGWDNLYVNDLYNGTTRLMDFEPSEGPEFRMPAGLFKRSGTPGTASSSYEGYMYYDTGYDNIVYCAYDSGSSLYKWYQVSASAL